MHPTKAQLRCYLSFAGELACRAGAILKRGFSKPLEVKFKGSIDPVTQYDVKSEEFIVSRIAKAYPRHAIMTEEGSNVRETSEYRWIVDPLDGTVNYAHRFPIYCVSIALQHRGESIVGVVFDPERGELFASGRNLGSLLNGKAITVSAERSLQRSLLATGFAYDVRTARRNNLGLFARMVKTAQAVRRPGSAAIDLCWLAAGRLDGFWEFHLHPWDTAAASLIVTEAGGTVSRLNGRPYSIFDKDILASNGRIHAAMCRVLTGRAD